MGLALPMLGGNPLCADIRDEPLAVARERGCKTFDLTAKESIQQIRAGSFDGSGEQVVVGLMLDHHYVTPRTDLVVKWLKSFLQIQHHAQTT